jgi:chromosome segregation ATPase
MGIIMWKDIDIVVVIVFFFVLSSSLLDVATELCNVRDSATVLVHSEDVWDTILLLTRQVVASSKRKSNLEEDTSQIWKNFNIHAALCNLLTIAVSHKNLLLRKAYIERIMTCSSSTQRLLMSLIERKKRGIPRYRTPSKSVKNRPQEFASLSGKKATSVAESLLASPTNHALSTPPKVSSFQDSVGGTAIAYDSKDTKSPFQQRKQLFENQTPPSRHARSPATGQSERKSKSTISGLSPPNFLRRGDHPSGGTGQDSFSSAIPQSPPTQAPPPSSERLHRSCNGLFSPGLGDTAEYETQVQNLRDENQDLIQQLRRSRKKEEEFSKKVDDMESKFRQELLKVERESIEHLQRSKEEYQNKISNVQRELAEVTEELSRAREERDLLTKLKDEIEVMSHMKSQLDETTERLRTYKEKVQHLSDVKDALQREQEAHARSVDENLRLKNEVQAFQPVKRQLDEYKEKAIDMEVRYTDCHTELAKLREQKISSSDINQQMELYVLAQEEEIQELRRRVKQNDDATKGDGTAVGEGISELNPELKAEVISLRNENMYLRAFAKKREVDEVVRLEQEVDDKTMLAERYKTQFLSTKNQLEDTIISLEEAKDRENKLELDVEEKIRVSERFKSQYLNTKEQLESTQMSLQESKNRESKLRSELADSFAKIKVIQEEVDELSNQLVKRSEELNAGIGRESKLEEELAVWAGEAKNAQEHANDLSRRLKKSHAELEESHNRESELLEQVAQYKKNVESLEGSCTNLSDELKQRSVDLDQCQVRVSALEKSIAEWTDRAEESHEHAKNVSSQLVKCQQQLESRKEDVAELEATLLEVSALKNDADENSSRLQQELDRTTKTLEETFASLKQSKACESSLKNEIADLSCRAEDAETISRQRMELVQCTREKVQDLEETICALENEKKVVLSDVQNLTEASKETEATMRSLESELEETRSSLNDTEEKLAESQALVDHLKAEVATSKVDYQAVNEKLFAAEDLTRKLQDELVDTRELLKSAQEQVKAVEVREASTVAEVERCQEVMSQLESNLETEINARNGERTKLEESIAENTKLKEEIETQKEELIKKLDSEKEKVGKLKQELNTCQDSLNAMHITLGSSNHREKMLKHEISKLEDKLNETENNLAKARTEIEVSLRESSQSLDSVRQVLSANAEKELSKLQQNMNQLLEDERKAKREQDEAYKEKIKLLTEENHVELMRLTEMNEKEIEKNTEEFRSEIGRIHAEYDEVRASMEKKAGEEKADLMEKGKGMIKDIREKLEKENQDLSDDVTFLTEKLLKEEDDKKRLGIQFQTKIVEYKRKLQAVTGRVNILSSENTDFEDRVKLLERERGKLREENDRYRRQLGGRSGSDSVLQNQVDMLQTEFQNAIDENRELKKRLKNQAQNPYGSTSEDSATNRYGRNTTNQHSTLVQLRAEYEETIDSMNSEKRELIMKNSAALTDVQKAEKRTWEVEQENTKLKQDLTSIKLSNERLENLLSNVQEESENLGHISTYSNISISEMSSIPQPPSELGDDSFIGKIMDRSFQKEDGVLSANREHMNAGSSGSNTMDKNAAATGGFTSTEVVTKRWMHSASLQTPYRSRPIIQKKPNDPPEN